MFNGLLLSMVAVTLLTFADLGHAQTKAVLPTNPTQGRYQLFTEGVLVFMVDSATGKVWMYKSPKETPGRQLFVYLPRLDSPEEVAEFLRRYRTSTPDAP